MHTADVPEIVPVITSYSIHYTKLYDTAEDGLAEQAMAQCPIQCIGTPQITCPAAADLDRVPPFHEPRKVNAAVKDYAKLPQADSMVANFYAKRNNFV